MAGFDFNVEVDIKRVERKLSRQFPRAINKAATRALNRTAKQVRSVVIKHIAKETNTKPQKLVGALIKITGKAVRYNLVAVITSKRRGAASINLIKYVTPSRRRHGAFHKQEGVKAKAWNQNKTYKGSFIGYSKARGEMVVFARTGKARDKLTLISGPVIPNEFLKAASIQAMNLKARERWRINFAQDLRFYLSKEK